MNRILALALLVACPATVAASAPDPSHGLCRLDVDQTRALATWTVEDLQAFGDAIDAAASLAEYEAVAGGEYGSIVTTIMKHRKVPRAEGEAIVLRMMQSIQLGRISKAMDMNQVTEEAAWEKEFQRCLEASRPAGR